MQASDWLSQRTFSTVSESSKSWPKQIETYKNDTESTKCRLQAMSIQLLLMVENLTTSKKKINNNSYFSIQHILVLYIVQLLKEFFK